HHLLRVLPRPKGSLRGIEDQPLDPLRGHGPDAVCGPRAPRDRGPGAHVAAGWPLLRHPPATQRFLEGSASSLTRIPSTGGEPMSYRTPSFVHLLRRARRLLGTALAAALTLLLVPLGQPAAHAITTISGGLVAPTLAPFGPQANLPLWYGDGTGLRLQ